MTICHVMLRIFPDCLSPSPGCARAPQGLPSCPDYLAFQSEELACPSLVGACLPAPLRTQRPVFPSSVHPEPPLVFCSNSQDCLFILLVVSVVPKLLSLMSHLLFFTFLVYAFGLIAKKILAKTNGKELLPYVSF